MKKSRKISKGRFLFLSLFLLIAFTLTSSAQNAEPSLYAVFFDNSGSMFFQVNKVRKAGRTIVERTQAGSNFKLFSFKTKEGKTPLAEVNPNSDWISDKKKLVSKINSISVVTGRTTLFDSILFAAKELNEKYEQANGRFGKKILILITDGEDRASKITEDEILGFLVSNEIQVFVIGFLRDLQKPEIPKKSLTKFAIGSKGNVVFPSKKDKVRAIVERLFSQ